MAPACDHKHSNGHQDNRCSPYLPPSDRGSAIRDLKNQMRGPNRFSDVLSVRNNGEIGRSTAVHPKTTDAPHISHHRIESPRYATSKTRCAGQTAFPTY